MEDEAYSLLGILDVNMPIIYGEGKKALRRLQEEFIKISKDRSILAHENGSRSLYLASSPTEFGGNAMLEPCGTFESTRPFQMTNGGLQLTVHTVSLEDIPILGPRFWKQGWILADLACSRRLMLDDGPEDYRVYRLLVPARGQDATGETYSTGIIEFEFAEPPTVPGKPIVDPYTTYSIVVLPSSLEVATSLKTLYIIDTEPANHNLNKKHRSLGYIAIRDLIGGSPSILDAMPQTSWDTKHGLFIPPLPNKGAHCTDAQCICRTSFASTGTALVEIGHAKFALCVWVASRPQLQSTSSMFWYNSSRSRNSNSYDYMGNSAPVLKAAFLPGFPIERAYEQAKRLAKSFEDTNRLDFFFQSPLSFQITSNPRNEFRDTVETPDKSSIISLSISEDPNGIAGPSARITLSVTSKKEKILREDKSLQEEDSPNEEEFS